ncbi:MAG: undecaprenyl-diphosphate phosphatase, partial [Eggerthellaceae bacterium]|nr:undecaprenyl-diphosphate phosphatase [Eggerthellaceae bacterium]
VEKPIGKHGRVEAIDPSDPEAVDKALFKIVDPYEMDWKTAIKIGCFEVLAIIPGTSRSGATIIGGMLCGCSRTAAAEFTFFLAIPVMFGWGLVKAVKFFLDGIAMTQTEIVVLVVGILSAFIMGMIAIRFLMGYIKQNDFTVFGVYRIIIGLIVLGYFGTKALGLM